MKIPLPDLLRRLRFATHDRKLTSGVSRAGLAARLSGWAMRLSGKGALRRWRANGSAPANLPAPEGSGFVARANANRGD